MTNKRKWNFGVLLQLCLAAAYLYVIYGTDMVREPWIAKWDSFFAFAKACLPLVIFSTAVSVISGTLLRKSGYVSGLWILFVMIIVQTITICEWNGNVGFLLIYLLGRLAINTLCAILGGINVFMEMEGKESLTAGANSWSIIALLILGIVGGVHAYSNREDRPKVAEVPSVEAVIPANQETSSGANNTANLPEQVVISFPRTGMWKLTGQDSIKWTANLVIDEIGNNSFTGHFYWWGEKKGGKRNNFGRENFRGTYDPEKRKVSIQGHSLQGNTIGIGLGKYEAYLNKNNNDFESGTWVGGGVWEAKWHK